MDKFVMCLSRGVPANECAKLQTEQKATFFYKLKGQNTFAVYDSSKEGTPIAMLESNSLIPFKGVSGTRALVSTQNNQSLFVDVSNRDIEMMDTSSKIPVYLDRPSGQVLTLFPKPGMTWRDCLGDSRKSGCENRLWPIANEKTVLNVIDSQMMEEIDPLTGIKTFKLYYKVNGEYYPKDWTTPRQIEGLWIAADDVRSTPLRKPEIDIVRDESHDLPCPCSPPAKGDLQTQTEDIAKVLQQAHNKINQDLVTSLLNPNQGGVGKCLKPRQEKFPSHVKNPFKQYLETHWRKQAKQNDKIQFNQRPLTQEQLFAIDSLARTILGEMRGCVNKGLRYPMSVARVAMNRAYFSKEFAKRNNGKINQLSYVKDISSSLSGSPFDYRTGSLEETLTRVLSSSRQFSAWNIDDANVHLALCPHNLRGVDQEAWVKSVQVAAQAILNRAEFRRQTQEITMHHYTSNMTPDWADGKKLETNISVGGLPLDSQKCIKLWSDRNSRSFDWQAKLMLNY